MAILRSKKLDFLAPCRALIGRSPVAELQLSRAHVSSEHAALRWRNGQWLIRDLGSTNGTLLNGAPILAGESRRLAAGDELQFGGEGESWTVADVLAPNPCLVFLGTGEIQWGAGDLILLPSEHRPEASAFRDGESWWLDREGALRQVACSDVVELSGARARLLLPDAHHGDDTAVVGDELDIEYAEVGFKVSRDEEHVIVTIRQNALARELPARACLYALLTLARAYLADKRPEADRGWMSPDELADLLKASPEKVNVDIHRTRKLFQESGVRNANRIIERRLDSRRLRIGSKRLKLERMP